MARLVFTGDTSALSTTESIPFSRGLEWLQKLKDSKESHIGLDTETNVVDSILDRRLKVISISDIRGDVSWVVEWESLNEKEQSELIQLVRVFVCIIQNVSFDYSVIYKATGVKLEKVYDTMLGEQVLTNGLKKERGFHGLQAILERRFGLLISKEEQTTFESGPYSDGQVAYAGTDTLKLGEVYLQQRAEMLEIDRRTAQAGNKGLIKTIWWENEFVKVVSDMEMNGVRIDKDQWYKIADEIQPTLDSELAALNNIAAESLADVLYANDLMYKEDSITTNLWSSAVKRNAILELVYNIPFEKSSKVALKEWLKEYDPNFPEGLKLTGKAWNTSEYPVTLTDIYGIIKLIILDSKDFDAKEHLDAFILGNDILFSKCVDAGWAHRKNEPLVNWGSPTQRLKVFQGIDPTIPSTGKDVLEDYTAQHPIFNHYLAWNDVEYMRKNFGVGFYDNNVEPDGKHRTRFNQILATGRLSSVKPNLLNIPRDPRFRKCFIPDEGYDFLDADYDGQELVIVTELAKVSSWAQYLRDGHDLHSRNAELIFGDEWIEATEEGCAFYAEAPDHNGSVSPAYKKCKCKGHTEMRDNSKAVSFGSIYGISYIKLAFNLKISEDRAKFILKSFFAIVPEVADMMTRFGGFALANGFIIEPVFGRMRFFDDWRIANPREHGSVERASFNTPIQSSGSAILKVAFVLMRRHLNAKDLNSLIQLLLPYHDETVAQSKPEATEYAKQMIGHYMRLGAKLAGFNIDAEAKHGTSWDGLH